MLDEKMRGDVGSTGADRRLSGAELSAAFRTLKERVPAIRTRDAARELGVTEAELVACRVGEGVIRLEPDFAEILRAMPRVGEVMVLTRNEHCVHERHGRFDRVAIGPGHGAVLNHEIDLRLHLSHWRYGFMLSEHAAPGLRTSLQFFGIDGTAVHKIYLTGETNRTAFDNLIQRFRSREQRPEITVAPLPPRRPDRPDSEIDRANLHRHWSADQDPHDFFRLLDESGISRSQAVRLAEPEFAWQVEPVALRQMLEAVAEARTSIICIVGNAGCTQVHTGVVETIRAVGPWFNILDPRFNLHLREDAIHQAWIVRKLTAEGLATSFELFDKDGFCFVQVFGERRPGMPESETWRDIVAALPRI